MEFILSTGALAFVLLLGWLSPGPNMFAVMASSLEHGRQHGLATGLGLAIGAAIWAALAVLGVAILFELFPTAILTLKLIGAVYLVWLGIKSLKNTVNKNDAYALETINARSMRKSLITGIVVSITNPKAALFFGSIMTAFLPAQASGLFLCWAVIFCGVFSAILHGITATLFSTQIALRFFNQFQRWISGTFGALFIALGGLVGFSAIRELR